MNNLGIILAILVYSLNLLCSRADKNPIGAPLGHYPEFPQSYYKKPASYYRKCVKAPVAPDGSSLDVITVANRNGGRPFHNCRYAISTLKGLFFKSNNTYFPCLKPEVVGILRIGEPLPKSIQVVKGYHETIATKFPLPIQSATTGRPNVPITGAFLTEGFIFLKNTTVPYEWKKDENFYNARQEKIAIIKNKSKLYQETQLEQIISLHGALSTSIDHAELSNYNFNQNLNQNERRETAPFIVSDIQVFSTPTTRIIEDLLNEDYIQAERTFGLAGLRFEFEQPKNVTERIFKMINMKERRKIYVEDLGSTPQEASGNTVNFHTAFTDLARRTQNDLVTNSHDQAEDITRNSTFNFKVPAIPIPHCLEDIEIDPKGLTLGGSGNHLIGMGEVS